MKRARIRIQDDHKSQQLTVQANAWAEAGMLSAYVDALEVRVAAEHDLELANRGQAWLAWARDQIDAKDPLLRPIEIPVLANLSRRRSYPVSRRLEPARTARTDVDDLSL